MRAPWAQRAAAAVAALCIGACGVGPEPDISITCDDEIDSAWPQYTDFRQAWPDHRASCHVALKHKQRTRVELNALSVAYGTTEVDDEELAALYSICAESGPEAQTYLKYAPRPSPIRQAVRGALVLCPDHPDAALIKQLNG